MKKKVKVSKDGTVEEKQLAPSYSRTLTDQDVKDLEKIYYGDGFALGRDNLFNEFGKRGNNKAF